MSKLTNTWRKRSKYASVLLVIVIFGGLGTALLLTSHAATSTPSVEAKDGIVSSAASRITDTSTATGQAVKFGVVATSNARPNDTNTGYKNAPNYPGSLHACTAQIQSNTTYSFCDYPSGLAIGSDTNVVTNVKFIGCLFESNSFDDANVADYGDNITFSYDTFQPSAVSVPPVGHTQGYQYGIDQRGDTQLSVDHSNFWGFANGIQIGYSSQAKPLNVSDSWFHDTRADGASEGYPLSQQDHTDGILENYGGPSYDYMTFNHNTIVAVGNTNGLALQDGNHGGYNHLTVTNNYFSGFGFTVNLGGTGTVANTQFTGNTFGSDLIDTYGPLYDANWTTGNGNSWSGNKYSIASGTTWLNAAINGRYWWPSDVFGAENGDNPATFTAHTTDYSGE